MKSKLMKLISSVLILACLLSVFSVLSFADEGDAEPEIKDTLELYVNRDFEEGWEPKNGLGGQYKKQSFTIDSEELADYSYNHFVRVEVASIQGTGDDGFIEISDSQIITGGTVVEYDIKVDCYSNTGNAYFLSPYTDGVRQYVNIFTITGGHYYLQNGKRFADNGGNNMDIGSIANTWVRIANVYNFDQTLVTCKNCNLMRYTEEPANNQYNIPVSEHCPNCESEAVFYNYTIRTYFGNSDIFNHKEAINYKDAVGGYKLAENTYYVDTYHTLAVDGAKARIHQIRIGTSNAKAGSEGQGFLLDNFKFYNDVSPKDENGNPALMDVRSDITIETHGYGRKVDENATKTVNIEGNSSLVADYTSSALYMKVNCDYMLLKETRYPIFANESGAAYGAPIKVNGVIYIPFEPLLNATGYPVFVHDDGVQYDISTAGGASILTLYRDTAIVNGERVQLTAAPFMAQDPDDENNVYPVIAMDDLSVFFPGYYVTYDEMGLIAISEGENILNRDKDLKTMMAIMQKFVFDHLSPEELYAKIEENTNGFDHPYLIGNYEQFDYLNSVYEAYTAKEAGEEYDETLIDDTLIYILKNLMNGAEKRRKQFTTLPDPADVANFTYLTYAYENTPEKYQVLAFELTNPFYGIMEGKLYTDSTSYGWDYAGPADEDGNYWGKKGVNYNDGYDWAGGRNSQGVNYSQMILEMAMAYYITGDIFYAELAYDMMISLCDDNNWHNWSHKHHLSTGEMLMRLGLAYDWLYDVWEEIQHERAPEYSLAYITQCIYRKGIYYSYDISRFARTSDVWTRDQTSPVGADGYIQGVWNWSKCEINWNCVCNSGIVMACMAIAGEESKLPGVNFSKGDTNGDNRVLWCMANNLNHISDYGLEQYAPDGSYIEGASYWGYATHYLSMVMWAVKTATGDDLGFYEAWGLDKTYYFAVQAESSVYNGSKQWYSLWAFHDCGGGYQDTYDYFFAAQMLNDDGLAAVRIENIYSGKGISWMDALGYKKEYGSLTLEEAGLDRDYRFEACEGVVSRSSWEFGGTYSGIMGGKNNFGNHGQIDSGIFTYVDDGYEWFPDMGSDEYNVYEYFGYGIRQYYYRNSAEGHNQIIMTSQPETIPFGQAYDANGKITDFRSEDAGMYAILDNASAYSSYANFARRGMLVTNNRETVVIQDEMSFKGAEKVYWLAHTKASITYSEDKKTAYLSQTVNGGREWIRVSIVSPDSKLKFDEMTCGIVEDPMTGKLKDVLIEGIHNSQYSTSKGGINEKSRQGWKRLVIKGEDTLGFNVAVVIEDVKGMEDTKPVGYEFTYMATWKDGGIRESFKDDGITEDNSESNIITSAKMGDITKYGKQAAQLMEKGYALDTRFVDFFKNLVRVTSAVNTFRPDSFKSIPQVWSAYEEYLVLLEYYNVYSGDINRTASGIKNISKGLCGI